MEHPVCLSHYFVNKQNVRSFGNIAPACLLKKQNNEDFLLNILQEKELVSHLTPELSHALFILRHNLVEKSKEDFRNYFPAEKCYKPLEPVNKEMVLSSCWTALLQIIPKQWYGSNHNLKVFHKFVKTVVYSMRGEHVIVSKMLTSWNFMESAWKSLPNAIAMNILHNALIWINKHIISPLICLNFYVTTTKLTSDEYKLYFFLKNEWHRYYDKEISKMLRVAVIKKDFQQSLGKKTRKLLSLGERLKRKVVKKSIPKLYLVLKSKSEYRPIVRYRNDLLNLAEKKKIKERLNLLKTLNGNQKVKLESKYYELHQAWIKFGQPKLYFVKADLTNAFGSVHKPRLMKILAEKHMTFQKTEKNPHLKRNVAQIYAQFVSELQKPLLIRAGSTVYIWNKGLVQGYKYSPALSELYYSYMDAQNFTDFLQKQEVNIKFLTRVVDDYFFVTDSLEMAHGFLSTLSNYKNVNYSKTVVNFDHPTIQKSTLITFLGYTYNTTNLQVSRAPNVFSGQMCYKIGFSPAICNTHKFLESRIGQSGIQINGHLLNFYYNDEELVWRHVFTTLCLSANKFCTILAIITDEKEMAQYLGLYKKRVSVKLCNSIVETLLRNKPDGFLFMYCVNHFRYLAWHALWLCARKTPKCNKLVPLIVNEMAKCNCLFGKWRAHASVITKEGVAKYAAIQEVCRRTDLRAIVKSFNEPPSGFQFYNNKCRCD